MTLFYSQTTKRDFLQSLLVIFFLGLFAILPSLFGRKGIFLGTVFGLAFFVWLWLLGIFINWQQHFQTASKLSEVVRFPSKLLFALFCGFLIALIARQTSVFNRLANNILIVLFSSGIEFISIMFIASYSAIVIVFLFRHKGKFSDEAGKQREGLRPSPTEIH